MCVLCDVLRSVVRRPCCWGRMPVLHHSQPSQTGLAVGRRFDEGGRMDGRATGILESGGVAGFVRKGGVDEGSVSVWVWV